MEQDVFQCDSDRTDCMQEVRVLQFIIQQKDKDICNLEDQVKAAMTLFDLESGKTTLLTDQNNSLIMDNFELQNQVVKLKRSRDGWIIAGVVTISVGALITTIVIAAQ